MAKLSPAEIAEYAHDAGFRGQDLTVAVAVALAESSGDTKAHNPVAPDDSYGLWQINMHGGMGPDRREEFGLDSNRELFDPEENAKAAWAISGQGNSFEPWSTYTNGAYRQYLDEARAGIRKMDHGKPPGGGEKPGGGKPGGGKPGSGKSGDDGFQVDPAALTGYVTITRRIADELSDLSAKQLRGVRGLAADSFGRIGRETGFAEALEQFGGALQRQVRGVGDNAGTLARSVSRTAGHYQTQEQDIAEELMSLLRRR